MIQVESGIPHARVPEAVLFPFDDHAFPFTAGLRLHLAEGKRPGIKSKIVVARGQAGEADDERVRFYGTVMPVGDELRMWYLGTGTLEPERGLRPMYAVSRDGVTWEKPKLGLVEYNGSTENNIVDFGGCDRVVALPIIEDPADPDPNRRFKVAFESGKFGNCLAVGFSPDGLRWTVPDWNPVAPMLEQTGLIRYNGCYYVNGQGGRHFGVGRKLVTFASYDFQHWTQSTCMGFRRDPLPPRLATIDWNANEEVHLGAGLWDRGNVIIGIYDMWHGHPTGDRSFVTMDLGLVVSGDALHYREPIPDFRLVPALEETGSPPGRGPSISHGQGMVNWGDRTLLYYELWGYGDVRMVSWPRDRLGYFRMFEYTRRPVWMSPDAIFIDVDPHTISCALRLDGPARVYANVDGLSQHAEVTVEVLDEQLRPLPGYSGEDVVPLRVSGLREPVVWRDRGAIDGVRGAVRLKVTIGGLRPEDPRLYALYVTNGA